MKKNETEKTFVLRIPKKLYEAVEKIAEQEERSSNGQILMFIRQGINSYKPQEEQN